MSNKQRTTLFLFGAILFVISAYFSCREVKYAIWGESTNATILDVRKSVTSRGRRVVTVQAVRYRFVEKDGTPREDKMSRDLAWKLPSDRTLVIDYLRGVDGESRPHGERAYVSVVIFLGSLAIMGFFLIRLLRQAYSY